MTDHPPRASEMNGAADPLLQRELNGCYRIDALIARGGMGSVYRAERLSVGTLCALKVLTPGELEAEDGNYAQRFAHEAKLTARLAHPNCVTVIDFGQTPDGILYLAMELLEGQTLAQALIADGPFPIPRFLSAAHQICAGVQAAHELGIVHRDLKTANIFLVQRSLGAEVAKVLDFGIAKRPQDTALAFTRPGQMLGTPTYMAPEQILDRALDTRADIYSLGVIFYELLIGRPPFDGADFLDILAGHAREPVPAMAAIRPDIMVPAELETVVRRMLEKEPDRRYADLELVLEALARVDSTLPAYSSAFRASSPSWSSADVSRISGPDARTRISRAPPPPSAPIAEPVPIPVTTAPSFAETMLATPVVAAPPVATTLAAGLTTSPMLVVDALRSRRKRIAALVALCAGLALAAFLFSLR